MKGGALAQPAFAGLGEFMDKMDRMDNMDRAKLPNVQTSKPLTLQASIMLYYPYYLKELTMGKSFELEGCVKEIMDLVTYQSGFCKREFVVTDEDDRYPQDVKFTMLKANCGLLDGIQPQDRVRVHFSIRGNLYNGKYYNDLHAYKIEKLEVDGSSTEPLAVPAEDFDSDVISDDEMPF